MAPGPKRKRPDRTYSQDDDRNSRPSPHRPQNLALANAQPQNNSPRGGGGRRQSRNSGRGGSSMPQSPNVSHASPMAMSPPANTFPLSRPTPATQSTTAPPIEQPSIPSHNPEVPESNEYLTPARVAHWNVEAREAVVQAAVSALRDGDVLTLSVIFHEVIEATIDGSMDSNVLGSIVRDIVAAPTDDRADPVSTFLDTLSSLTQDKDKRVLVRQMLTATDIDVSRMRTELENELLTSLGLVRDSFGKMAVRKATHALYRQSNYNLLREETEGYSKLMTEYFTTVNSQPPTQEVVSETYQRVNALIGAFDLDIGRVLDVTLDVFANLLVKHGRFFVKLLRSSAWWPELRGLEGIEWENADVSALPKWAQPDSPLWHYSDQERDDQLQLREQRDRKFWQRVGELGDRSGIEAFFELGGHRIIANNRQPDQTMPAEGAPLSKQQAARKWADEWMEQTKTLPPPGNDVAAQLLGFKLRFYASDTRDSSDFLPDNLIYLAALLIKIGFISILDLYPHLYPQEDDMSAHKDRLLKAKKEKERKDKGGVANALTMAGVLPDDTLPPAVSRLRDADAKPKSDSERSTPTKTDEASDKKKALPEPADQKFQLLKSLLCIGALPEALFILGRHPWMLEAYPELLKLIFRLAHHSLSKVYETARPTSAEQIPILTKGAGLRTAPRPSDYIPRRTLRWAKPDERDAGDGIDYKFYWEDWVDNVPICQEVDDVIKLCSSLLGLVGPECGQDIILLTKIVRIGKKSLVDDTSITNRKRWINFSATFIAPALSFTGRNPGIINEVWDLFKQFDTATRYTIYQQWFSAGKPAIRAAFAEVQSKTKYELSRISATNTKEYGRKIAKVSYSSPGIVFQMTVKQLVAYPNMIDALVECSRYLTLLGYDCLTWTLVRFFLNPDKGSTQDDGMLSAGWLKNIASFVGKAYQKYHLMDPIPVLQFTTNQLLHTEGELYMLDVLEQMIKSMGGISLSGSVSESMTLALCAGPVLRTFTLQHHLADHRHQAGSSARRLVRCLKDTGLAPQILIALAQHVEAYVHRDDQQDTPDKVVLFNVDKLRSNLIQYLELLRAYLSADDFDILFPSLIEMMSDFCIEPDVAFTVARGSIAAKAKAFRVEQQSRHNKTEALTVADTAMGGVEETSFTNGAPSDSAKKDAATTIEDVVMSNSNPSADIAMEGQSSSIPPVGSRIESSLPDLPNPEIEKLADQLRTSLPDTFAKHPCLSFYVTFWQLSLPDVDEYGISQQYRDTIGYFERQLPPIVPERRGYKPNIPRKDTEEARRAKAEIAKLKEEQQIVTKTNTATQDSLRIEMRRWFDNIPMVDSRSDALHNALLQDCFIPRSRLSLEDAQFASAMLKFMHKSGVPGFRTIKLLDLLFNSNKLTCIISMYTEEESRTFGRFLSEILRELQVWHENKNDAYAKCAHGTERKVPGFGKRFDVDRHATDFLKYEEFCMLLYKWHKALFTAIKTCIDSGNYMQIRNSIIVLNALNPSFPRVDVMANELRQTITQLGEAEERLDLKRSLQSILGGFNKTEKLWQKEHEFRNLPAPPPPTNGADKTVTEKAKTPQPNDTKIDVTATAFRPKTETNGMRKGPTDKLDESASKRIVSAPAPSSRDREAARSVPQPPAPGASTPSQQEQNVEKFTNKPGPPMHPSSVPTRPDNRSTPTQSIPANRPSHNLPSRPDSQPARARQSERPAIDRPPEHGMHGRYDGRGPSSDYGRLDRSTDAGRQRETSPGRRPRPIPGGRTPERLPPVADPRDREWAARDYDERAMRAPPRDVRAPPARPHPGWDSRDPRDARDQRERSDSRGHALPPTMEPRRMPSNPSIAHEHGLHRRDMSLPGSRLGIEREEHGALRQSQIAVPPATEGPTVNPARAALINQVEHGRHETSRPDRDGRRDRGSRPQSPRRGEDRRGDERRGDDRLPPGHQGRNEVPREHRDERISSQALPTGNRDRRDEPTMNTPTGPRGGRGEGPQSARASREMFQPTQGQRSLHHQVQDPNYGRLNQPSDSIPPSGPRSERPQTQSQPPTPTVPSGPAVSHPVGIHPSRLENIQGGGQNRPPVQTNVPNAPSGPRGATRPPQVPLPPSPVSRGTPTGPAAIERASRNTGNPLRAINSVLTQNAPSDRPSERGQPTQNPPIRGRGATHANGPTEAPGDMTSPMPPPSHVSTPNSRADGQHPRSNRTDTLLGRTEGTPQEDKRSESRGHRDSRRSERPGRERSPDRGDKRPDDRSGRNPSTDRLGPIEQERGPDRDRGGREKRSGDREHSRREREREGERSNRDPERSGREPRDSSRRERGSRDDGRASGRDERDRRSRGGGGADDGRKRTRDPADQGQPHGEIKRRR
ncbi:transcription factor/nuclear export subunit protein 2-domain-containing protein [Pyrenochaeta sp. MPI-SDFR-AT-0127]|nr:transcription factor/nuclear export subunit protein 2-domain-containing protein [Pyrenochaeta sp. MPI-SDFR-AT-0127]